MKHIITNVVISGSLHFSFFSLHVLSYPSSSTTLYRIIVGSIYVLFYSYLVSIILTSKVSSSMRSNVVCLFYVIVFYYRVLFADQHGMSVVQYRELCHSKRLYFIGFYLLW